MISGSVLHETILCSIRISTYSTNVSSMAKMVAFDVISHYVFSLANFSTNTALPALLR